MYNLEQLEEYAQKIYDRYDYFNEYTLETIGRRIKETGRLSAYDQQALKNIADISGDMEAITKELARITEMNIKDIEAVYTQVVKDGQNTYKPLYDFKGMRQIPLAKNDYLQKIVNSWAVRTEGKMINLSRTKALCFDSYDAFGNVTGSIPLAGAYEQAMSEAVQAVSSGTVDFNTAMRKTVERMGGSGVRVNYGNGVTRNLSSAIRQNVLWGAKKTAQDYESYVGEELGLDGFEVDAHAGCRPSHLFMQGQIYSYKGDKTVNGVTYKDGSRALEAMTDYGCLHFKISVLLGVSESRYSARELARIERESTELIEYNGRQKTLYEWKQTQRTLERGVKKAVQQGNMLETAGNHTAAKQYADKAKQFRRAYDDMCAGVPGLEPRLERMRVYKNGSGKTVDNYGKSGIINAESEFMYRKGKGNHIEPMPKKQLLRIEKCFKRRGGTIRRGDDIDDYLVSKKAEAITYNQDTILLKKSPGRASVFEELIHATQYKNGDNDGSYLSRLKCEISAQEKLLKNAKAYKLTESEIKQTKIALEEYKKEMAAYKIRR